MPSSGMHIEEYGLQTPEPINPLVVIIKNLFSHELHEHAWKAYTKDTLIELIKIKVKERNIKLTEQHYVSLKRKLGRCKTMEECLTVLTDVAFGTLAQDNE